MRASRQAGWARKAASTSAISGQRPDRGGFEVVAAAVEVAGEGGGVGPGRREERCGRERALSGPKDGLRRQYVAYATAADPVGDELDATSSSYGGLSPTQNATQIYGPLRSRAAEVGTKWELMDRHLLATASLFQTKVSNARENAPNNLPGYASGTIVPGAAYRVQGLDFEVAGKITDQWSVIGGLVFLKTRVTHSVVPTNIGLQLANIAHQSFNLLTKYRVTPWLEFGGQGIYASQIKGGSLLVANGGAAYPNRPNPTLLPSHWRFDAFAEAKVNPHLSLKLYGQNLFDKTYYDSFYQSAQPFVAVAPGRSVSLIAAVKF